MFFKKSEKLYINKCQIVILKNSIKLTAKFNFNLETKEF